MYKVAREHSITRTQILLDRKNSFACHMKNDYNALQLHCDHYDIMDINTDGDKIEYIECAVCCWCGEEQQVKFYATKLKHGKYNTDRT
ncbi:MAG: hypothetical protein ACHQVK_04725 [Candidatus Paceibacterales bacterium]